MRVAVALCLGMVGCGSAAGTGAGPAAPPARAPRAEPAPVAATLEVGSLAFRIPVAWTRRPPGSPMRRAELVWPSARPEDGPAECVVYFFGRGGAGAIRANVDRWLSQIVLDPGEVHDVAHAEYAGLSITTVRATGRYVAETRPGSGERVSKPGQRLVGAIVEAEEGPYYFKVLGPDRTVRRWEGAFDRMLASVRVTDEVPAESESLAPAHPEPEPEPEAVLECPEEPPEPSPRTVAERGPITVRGPLSHRLVFPVLEAHMDELAACVADAVRSSRPAEIHLRLVLTGDGAVRRLRLEDPPEELADTESCMACAARAWTFPAAKEDAFVIVDAPVSFRRRGGARSK